jgi:hypothetical protein
MRFLHGNVFQLPTCVKKVLLMHNSTYHIQNEEDGKKNTLYEDD